MTHQIKKTDLKDFYLNDVVCASTSDEKRLEVEYHPASGKVSYKLYKSGTNTQTFGNIDDGIEAYNKPSLPSEKVLNYEYELTDRGLVNMDIDKL